MTDYTVPSKLDRLIHNPGRLAILAVLLGCESADFTFLQQTTELNKGTLSKQLTALEQAGYIEITKRFVDRLPNTSVRITPAGRKALRDYRRQYKAFMERLDEADQRR
jgi:DNA-binding MarR family transcriptional regulator